GEAFVGLMATLFGALVGLTYSVFFTGYCGQTPGKMALRIKVIRATGEEIGYGRAFVREVPGKFLSGILLGIGYLMAAFDSQKQGLHDRIADTYVIKL
ncbi:MAG: RDD family protein, partial [Trichloromonas sp.]|nr:RDD family protein [Trichloromonas sp.]